MAYSRKKLELTGQRFGRLTVTAPAENANGRTAWQCRCDCGREVVAKTRDLRRGHTVSCGVCHAHGVTELTYVDGTCVEMLRARTVRRNNTSGVPGVSWDESKNAWRASICFKGKRYYLGRFSSFDEAVRARREAESRYFDSFLEEFAAKAHTDAAQHNMIDSM